MAEVWGFQKSLSQDSKKKNFVRQFERPPQCYREAEKVLIQVKACKGNFKTVMFNSRLRGQLLKKVYALVSGALHNWPVLERIMEDTELLVKEPFLRKEFAAILIQETVCGKGLPGESKPVLAIRKHEEDIRASYNIARRDVTLSSKNMPSLPRYARVNTIATSVTAVLEDLRNFGFQQVYYDKNTSLDGYMNLVKSLQVGYFIIDYHFKDLLVFASEERLPSMRLHQNGHIFIQDKSSYIPVHALNPKPGDTVLDACAAPGMKTVHIAAAMNNEGKIYAYERDKGRFETLKETLDFAGVTISESECEDFYMVNADDPKFKNVECILVDPSCSGSGMVNRLDSVTDTVDSKNPLRLQKLAGFQILLLKHALLFRSVKRVVYSTCSVTEEENEYVVHEVLNKFRNMFKLVSVMPDWPIRGSDNFEYGPLCLRAYPNESLTNGFFVAMFERLECVADQSFPLYKDLGSNNKWLKRDKKKRKGDSETCEFSDSKPKGDFETFSEEQNYGENDHGNNSHAYNDAVIPGKDENDPIENSVKKRKRSKDHEPALTKSLDTVTEKVTELNVSNDVGVCENSVAMKMETDLEKNEVKKKHKKKKHNHKDQEMINEEVFDDTSENTIENELESNVTKKKHKKKKNHHKEQEMITEEIVDDASQITVENELECNSTKKKHKRKRNRSEDQETIFDENTLRLKMDEDIENEKKLYEGDENTETPSSTKKNQRKKHKESIEKSDSCSKRSHKKSKSLVCSESEGINDKSAGENLAMSLEHQPMADSPTKKHKKKCKDKKNRED